MICSPCLICFLIFVSPRFSWTMRSCHWQNLWISMSRLWPHSPPSSSPNYYLNNGWDQQVTAKRSPQSTMKKPWVLTLLYPSVSPNFLWPIYICITVRPPHAQKSGWRWRFPSCRVEMDRSSTGPLKVESFESFIVLKFWKRKLKNEKSPVEWRWTDLPRIKISNYCIFKLEN